MASNKFMIHCPKMFHLAGRGLQHLECDYNDLQGSQNYNQLASVLNQSSSHYPEILGQIFPQKFHWYSSRNLCTKSPSNIQVVDECWLLYLNMTTSVVYVFYPLLHLRVYV